MVGRACPRAACRAGPGRARCGSRAPRAERSRHRAARPAPPYRANPKAALARRRYAGARARTRRPTGAARHARTQKARRRADPSLCEPRSAGSRADPAARRLTERVSVFEYEGHLHGDPILLDLAVLDARLVLDDVKAGNAAQGPVGPRQPLAHGGIKALG